MQVIKEGSVRVDLLGGTLDIEPIYLILREAVTLNFATNLKARVKIKQSSKAGLTIHSLDYDKCYHFTEEELSEDRLFSQSQYFKEMTFVLQILYFFKVTSGLELELSSGAPPGSGLGGSSAMGVTLFQALCEWKDIYLRPIEIVQKVKSIEARILNQGMPGFQDYFPALLGGVLAIKGQEGEIKWEQLFSEELKFFLEKHLYLVYSGQSRESGINNWEVYKSFFDQDQYVRDGLQTIATLSAQAFIAIKNKKWKDVLHLICLEGLEREKLFPEIKTQRIQKFQDAFADDSRFLGLKMCGAGGGGCFIVVHDQLDENKINNMAVEFGMEVLPLKIENPIS